MRQILVPRLVLFVCVRVLFVSLTRSQKKHKGHEDADFVRRQTGESFVVVLLLRELLFSAPSSVVFDYFRGLYQKERIGDVPVMIRMPSLGLYRHFYHGNYDQYLFGRYRRAIQAVSAWSSFPESGILLAQESQLDTLMAIPFALRCFTEDPHRQEWLVGVVDRSNAFIQLWGILPRWQIRSLLEKLQRGSSSKAFINVKRVWCKLPYEVYLKDKAFKQKSATWRKPPQGGSRSVYAAPMPSDQQLRAMTPKDWNRTEQHEREVQEAILLAQQRAAEERVIEQAIYEDAPRNRSTIDREDRSRMTEKELVIWELADKFSDAQALEEVRWLYQKAKKMARSPCIPMDKGWPKRAVATVLMCIDGTQENVPGEFNGL